MEYCHWYFSSLFITFAVSLKNENFSDLGLFVCVVFTKHNVALMLSCRIHLRPFHGVTDLIFIWAAVVESLVLFPYAIFRETLANRSSFFLCICRFHAVVCLICLDQLFRFLTTLSLSSSAPILWSRPTMYSTAMQYFVSNAIFVFFVLWKMYWPCLHLRWWYGVGLTTELSCSTLSQSPLSSVSFYEDNFFLWR